MNMGYVVALGGGAVALAAGLYGFPVVSVIGTFAFLVGWLPGFAWRIQARSKRCCCGDCRRFVLWEMEGKPCMNSDLMM